MTPTHVVQWLLIGYFALYPLKIIVGRVLVFNAAYHTATIEYARDVRQAERCRDHETRDDFQHVCDQAMARARIAPFERALDKMMESTYLCGDESCVELLHRVLMSWPTMIILITLIVAMAWSASHSITQNVTQLLAKREVTRRQRDAAQLRGEDDTDPVRLIANVPDSSRWEDMRAFAGRMAATLARSGSGSGKDKNA